MYILKGIKNTLLICLFCGYLGYITWSYYFIINNYHKETNKIKNIKLAYCNLYVTIIRGTPTLVQLMIIYYVNF
jgi:ABC-type amino acid transport system permease subunit